MRDQYFEAFIAEAGEAKSRRKVSQEQISKYRNILPNALLQHWQEEGWCCYANGLFWTVNPDEYKHLLDMWLTGTDINELDNYHVIARSGFGALYAWGEKYNQKIIISCPTGSIVALKTKLQKPNKDPDMAIRSFFSMFDKEKFDIEDGAGNFIFEQALKKLGPLEDHELYGFVPALFVGGEASIDHVVKCDLDVHLTVLRQLR